MGVASAVKQVVGVITRDAHLGAYGGTQARVADIVVPQDGELFRGSFRGAVNHANKLLRASNSEQYGLFAGMALRRNDSGSMAILDAGQGAFRIFRTGASATIHNYDVGMGAKYLTATVTRPSDSPLLAVVSRNRIADLRHTEQARSQLLVRIAGQAVVH